MRHVALAVLSATVFSIAVSAETLPPLMDGKAPTTFDQLWDGFDPRREPLNTEVCKEWDADGITCHVVRFDVGTFKSAVSKLALLYAFPKGAVKLSGLVQMERRDRKER